ncbi:hypothetical protein EJ110_NYTH43984 [Nymphaea thermarum]|nr:hypothetical protein EJ110_NYTH43984 [Nymphaea thermarum]
MLVIHGMGGLGKTTVAKAVYNKIYGLFKFDGFISNIREESLASKELIRLQSQLVLEISQVPIIISNARERTAMLRRILPDNRVLIVLDDVDNVEQVRALVGQRTWFHPGSRAVTTTRIERVLALHGWDRHQTYAK